MQHPWFHRRIIHSRQGFPVLARIRFSYQPSLACPTTVFSLSRAGPGGDTFPSQISAVHLPARGSCRFLQQWCQTLPTCSPISCSAGGARGRGSSLPQLQPGPPPRTAGRPSTSVQVFVSFSWCKLAQFHWHQRSHTELYKLMISPL